MPNSIDIKENDILERSPELLDILLIDRTTNKPIFWATDNYEDAYGENYAFSKPILKELITGVNGYIIVPRAAKSKEQQEKRSRDMAEVFTPSWVCNKQNNLVDEAWFGRKDVFNVEIDTENGHIWETNKEKIVFPEGKTWKDYVRDTRLEMSCGEAPYIASRYDTTTGEYIEVNDRIGILDRKLRVVSENTDNTTDWLLSAREAYENVYGFEWQGDNLIIARETLLYTLLDFFHAKFGKEPILRSIITIAEIISWNFWQMDGLRLVVPNSCDNVYQEQLFGDPIKCVCPACKKDERKGHIGIPCKITDWRKPKDDPKRIITFASLVKD